MYELFAILVHSGSAYGGHYFAYIKDLQANSWVAFNDVTVRPIRISEIQRVFGGHDSRSNFCFVETCVEAVQNYTNAYMLMYRKVGLPRVQVELGDIPDYIQELVDSEEKIEVAQKQVASFKKRC